MANLTQPEVLAELNQVAEALTAITEETGRLQKHQTVLQRRKGELIDLLVEINDPDRPVKEGYCISSTILEGK
jgi:hypothetical protein